MTESEKLIKQLGGKQIACKRHRVYVLNGYRFTLHQGGKPNHLELTKLRKRLRQLGILTDKCKSVRR